MNPATPLHGCFVTGTDTEIGKTRISAALLHWAAQSGWRSAGLKPVSAGTDVIDGQRVNEDVRALREAGSLALTDVEVGPVQLEAACAPHIAAALEGRAIDRATVMEAARALGARADVLVVEVLEDHAAVMDDRAVGQAQGRDLAQRVVGVELGARADRGEHAVLQGNAILLTGFVEQDHYFAHERGEGVVVQGHAGGGHG